MTNNFGYCLAVEKLAGIKVPERAEYIRVIMAELQRVASHLMSVGFLLNELGAYFTPIIYAFRDREKIVDLFEMVSGQRMMYTYLRIGGVSQELPEEFIPAVKRLVVDLRKATKEYEDLLSGNEVLIARMKGVGVLSPELAVNASASGPVLRASGIKWDIRKAEPYSIYDRFKFEIPTAQNGDCYDRYWVRIEEMKQSLNIIEQAVKDLPGGEICTKVPALIRPPKGEVYGHIEAPRGDLGFYIVSDNSIAPYRIHIKPPTLINLTTMKDLCVGWKVADFIVIFGSIDVVLGEMDR